MAMNRNIIVALVLVALCGWAEGTREQAARSFRARAKLSRQEHKVMKLNESAFAADEEAAEDDMDSDEGDDNDESNPEIDEAKDALHVVQWKKETNAGTLEEFKDVKAFDGKVGQEAKVVANETQSPGLAHFLVEIRDEMRTYADPAYSAHLESKAKKLEAEEQDLEAKLAALEKGETPPEKKSKDTVKAAAPAAKTEEKPAPEKKKLEVTIGPTDTSKALAKDEAEIKELKAKVGGGSTQAGHVFAFAFLGTVTMLSAVFAMANSGRATVRNYTWFLVDQVTAIFLAVMYFQAFDDLLDFIDIAGHHKVLSSVIHALVMLSLALALAFILRKQEVGLAILCGAGAHVTSFTSIHAAAVVQNNVWMGMSYHWLICLVGLAALAVALACIGAAVFKAKQAWGVADDDGFMDKTDDMENDFGAMAFSVCWSMFVRFLITGHHPAGDDTEFDHTPYDRHCMLANAFISLAIAVPVVQFCAKAAENKDATYFSRRVMGFVTAVAAMNVAWSFFYWAEWELFESYFAGQPIFGRVAFALLSTTFGGLGIQALTAAPKGGEKVKKVTLTALGLMVAWSWELCFDAAIDDMCEGRSHPAMYKMGACAFMFAVVIPVYGIYMKPKSMPAAEAIGA